MKVEEFRDVVASWHADEITDGDVVQAAGELVVAGVDGPAVSTLAGASLQHAQEEMPPLLGDALGELGLEHHEHGTEGGRTEALRLMARRTLAEEMSPRELARWVRRKLGSSLPEAEKLAYMDGAYRTLDYRPGLSEADVDFQVMAEVRRLTS
ncbi:hypothetical protein [Lentzea albida]|uniref:Uncharacterized protein n=1 Tax=Lentzea albida TaxID=65499 RepID=A0A1H9CI04_9PSEU|nr:hypothetical protein [Lentzea albida]SEQ00789.1 hypothetical protein SAMN04488000_101947 [Lentzea albida]